jgi:fibronectin-binding autotransporter adhesin
VTGAFSTVTGSVPTAGLAQSVSVSAQTVDLVLSPISSATGTIPSETVVVAPTNDTVFSAVTTTAILNGQWANRMLLDRWGLRSFEHC